MSDVPFRDYVETRLKDLEKRLDERFEAQEKAVRLAVAQSHWIVATAISILALLVSLGALFLKK